MKTRKKEHRKRISKEEARKVWKVKNNRKNSTKNKEEVCLSAVSAHNAEDHEHEEEDLSIVLLALCQNEAERKAAEHHAVQLYCPEINRRIEGNGITNI